MGIFSNRAQLYLRLESALLGVGAGLLYGLLRALRRHFACGRGATAALDLLFWFVLAAGVFLFGLTPAAGQPRGFVLAGAGGGMTLYFATLSSAVLCVLGTLLRAAARVRRGIARAMRRVQHACACAAVSDRIRHFAKKIQIPSSIFRRKGIK